MTYPELGPPTDAQRAEIARRSRRDVAERAAVAFREELAQWARDDTAPFPDRAEIALRVQEELVVLCSALGHWAAADPSELFEDGRFYTQYDGDGFDLTDGWDAS